jgi:hypothetical protein
MTEETRRDAFSSPGGPKMGPARFSSPTRRCFLAASATVLSVGLPVFAGVRLRSERTIHAAKAVGSGKGMELATYTVEKDKPLLTLVK